jgi:hypothetical protein
MAILAERNTPLARILEEQGVIRVKYWTLSWRSAREKNTLNPAAKRSNKLG